MLRSWTFSTSLHAGVVLAGVWSFLHEPPRAALAPSVPMALDVRLEPPRAADFEAPRYPESLPLADVRLEFEPETLVEDVDGVPPLQAKTRPEPRFDRPSRVSDRRPQPKVEAEEVVEIYNPPPTYPAAARRRGQEGHALLEVKVLKDGSVADPVVLECVGSPLFADAALKAVAAWRYQPVAVDRVHHVRFTFKMQS